MMFNSFFFFFFLVFSLSTARLYGALRCCSSLFGRRQSKTKARNSFFFFPFYFFGSVGREREKLLFFFFFISFSRPLNQRPGPATHHSLEAIAAARICVCVVKDFLIQPQSQQQQQPPPPEKKKFKKVFSYLFRPVFLFFRQLHFEQRRRGHWGGDKRDCTAQHDEQRRCLISLSFFTYYYYCYYIICKFFLFLPYFCLSWNKFHFFGYFLSFCVARRVSTI